MTTFSNATVLGVFLFVEESSSVQTFCRISLAVSDVLVGIIVFPTFISTLVLTLNQRPALERDDGFWNCTYPCRDGAGRNDFLTLHCDPAIPQMYNDAIGFFTSLSVLVSLYTLVAAAFDRFWVVYRGLNYNPASANRIALIVIGVIWILSILVSVVPWFASTRSYGLVYAILIGASGSLSAILYSIAFIVPLVIMWIITVATFVAYKLYTDSRKTFRFNKQQQKDFLLQIHFLITLGIMVGIFTICVLPRVVFLIFQWFETPGECLLSNLLRLPKDKFITFLSAEVVTTIFLTSNSLWNFLIYSVRDKTFRKSSKKLYSRLLCGLKCSEKS